MQNMMIGVDLAKNVFQVHVASRAGEVQCRKKLSRNGNGGAKLGHGSGGIIPLRAE